MIDFVKTLYIKFVSIPSVSYCSKTLLNRKYKVYNTILDHRLNIFFLHHPSFEVFKKNIQIILLHICM